MATSPRLDLANRTLGRSPASSQSPPPSHRTIGSSPASPRDGASRVQAWPAAGLPLASAVRRASPTPAQLHAALRSAGLAPEALQLQSAFASDPPAVHGSLQEGGARAPSLSRTAGPSAEPDIDDLVDRVWRALADRMVVEHERRGLAKWA